LIKILVTGAGGGVGQGIIKSLKLIKDLPIKIIVADMSEKAVGLYAADTAYLVSACNSPDYFESLAKIFIQEKVDYYFPGTDIELKFCAQNKQEILQRFGVHIVISSISTIEIADDKYKTYEFLKQYGFEHPKTAWLKDAGNGDVPMSFPLIVKPAVGCRSIGVYKLQNAIELGEHKRNPVGLVVQECIGGDDDEYTCTIVKVGTKLSPVLALKRILRSGDTYRAEPIRHEVIEDYVTRVASILDIDGGCNFQLRLDASGIPKIFEINSRYSGTTPFCTQLGFNPVEFYLKHRLNINYEPAIDYSSVVLRYWAEAVVKKKQLSSLSILRQIQPEVEPQFSLFRSN